MTNKTITVKGVGNVNLSPNWVEISITLDCNAKTYGESLSCNAALLDMLQKSLEEIGFAKTDLKTTAFRVDPKYVYTKGKNGNSKSVLDGFDVTHYLELGFDFSANRLNEVLATLSQCHAKPVFRINFTMKDTRAAKLELLNDAVKNAKLQAETLTQALGVKLGGVQNVSYSWGEIDLYSETNYAVCDTVKPMLGLKCDIEPKDIDLQDTVTVVWEIAE